MSTEILKRSWMKKEKAKMKAGNGLKGHWNKVHLENLNGAETLKEG